MRVLIPGRFQPFHLGHLHLVEHAFRENDDIIILIENADESFTFNNPMTSGERIEMVREVLLKNFKNEFHRLMIFPMVNIKNNAEWVYHLKTMIPSFDLCYSNNPLVKILMENAGINVMGVNLKEREKFSGREIRRRISLKMDWESLVPGEVYRYIISRKIDERIRRLVTENDNIVHG